MKGMIPTELHVYSLSDIARGLIAASQKEVYRPKIELPGLGEAGLLRSARAAVLVALKSLQMAPDSRIGVPLYCCPVVFKAIKAAGCTPRFVDVDPDTYCLSVKDLRRKSGEIDALIAVHMFGNLCDMPAILEIMKGKPVIEDCAQSLGSAYGGRMCGSFGDISFFSFRSGKFLSVGEGGAIYAKSAGLRTRISELTEALPKTRYLEELKHVVETYIRTKLRSRPLWGLLGIRIWSAYNKRTEFADKSPIYLGRIFSTDLATFRRRILKLDRMIEVQRNHAEFLEKNLSLDDGLFCLEMPYTRYNRFMFPIRFQSTEQRDRIADYLRQRRVGTSKPYEEVIKGAAAHYGYQRDCPSAEDLLRRTLIIPSYYSLKRREIARIARIVNEACKRWPFRE